MRLRHAVPPSGKYFVQHKAICLYTVIASYFLLREYVDEKHKKKENTKHCLQVGVRSDSFAVGCRFQIISPYCYLLNLLQKCICSRKFSWCWELAPGLQKTPLIRRDRASVRMHESTYKVFMFRGGHLRVGNRFVRYCSANGYECALVYSYIRVCDDWMDQWQPLTKMKYKGDTSVTLIKFTYNFG